MVVGKRDPFILSHHCVNFNAYRSCGSGDIMILFCHMASRDHLIKGTCDYGKGSPLTEATTVPSLMLIGLVEVEV